MVDKTLPGIPAFQPRAKARLCVQQYVQAEFGEPLDADKEIYVVWFCKTLKNWKCLVSTCLEDGHYYEVTYNGDTQEIYLDDYKKIQNVVFPDFDIVKED